MKWHIVGNKMLELQTEHPKKGTFFAFVEDVSNAKEM